MRAARPALLPLLMALCALLPGPSWAQAAPAVPDAGFETPALSGSSPYQYDPSGAPWAFVGGSGIAGNGSAFGNPDAPEGSQAAFLQGTGAISQPLPGFQAATTYTLTVTAAQRNYNGDPGGVSHQTVQVTLDGAALGTITPTDTAYQDYSLTFTTSAGSHTLAFQGAPADANDDTAFLDDVRLAASPAAFNGYLDSADAGSIGGWAWDANQPNAPISVDVYDGATRLTTLLADGFRQDLVNAGIGNGAHGYSLPTPTSLLDGQPHTVHVYYAGTTTDLQQSPRTIQGAPGFDLSLGQSALTIAQGDSRGLPVTVTPTGGFVGPVSLSVSAPDGLRLETALVPASVSGPGTSRLIVTAGIVDNSQDYVAAGVYPLTVTATSGTVTHQQSLTLTVTALNYDQRSQLTLTDAGTAAGFGLTTFATGFPATEPQVGYGPFGIAFPGTGVLVSDMIAGNVRLFSSDVDNQDAGAAAVAPNGYSQPAGLATSGGQTYLCEYGAGDILRLAGNGHSLGQAAVGLQSPLGTISDPLNGHLFVTGGDTIYDVDPVAGTSSVWLTDPNGLDGLTISGDGRVLYSLSGDDDIVGYDTATKAQVFDLAALNPIAPVVQADGTAIGSGALAGKLYVNCNNGVVWQVDMTTGDCVQVAVGGTRGDFATPDPTNGSLMLTQSTTIMRLTPPAGGRFGQAPPAPLGLTATPGNTQVSLAWNPVPGATGYTLSRALSSAGPFLPVASAIPVAAWVDPGLTNGTTYFYAVSAANAFGAGPASNVASATPSGALPLPVNAAAFVSQAVPASMSAGQSYPVTVTLRNTGTSVWTAAGGYRLGSQAPQDNGTWGLGRVELPGTPSAPVQPGATAAFTFNVTAPAAPNTYDFQWRMVQDGVQWFGDFTPDVAVSVDPPPFQIVGVSEGDALTGDVMMTVAINDPTPDHSMTPDPLSLQIDGAEVSIGHVDPPSATSSVETITFDVHTPDYANGAHTITVTDNNTSSDTRTVSFANVIQNLSTSCMFDGAPLLVSATLDSPRPWQVLVKDAMGNPVKDIQGTGPAINVSWDGTDDQGNPIPQGYYVAMISAGDPVAAAAQGVKGFGLRPRQSIIYPDPIFPNPVERDFSKSTRGDVLIVLDQDVLNDPMTGQSNIVAYPAYIESKLGPHIGGDFENVPTFIEFSGKYTDPEILQEDTQEIQSILESSNLSFMYVHAHGEDYFKGWSGPAQQSVPFFEVGSNRFYSVHPTGNRKMQGALRSEYVVADHINPSYDAGDFPPPFVWMDTCCSAGSDGHGDPPTSFLSLAPSGVFPDNSWADAFSIDDLDGGFLGWMGTVPAYGQTSHNLPGPFGTPSLGRQADPASFDKFRIAIWEGMFTNKDYMNIPFDSAFANAFQAGGPASGNIFNVGVVRAADRGYYYGNPFLNFPSP